MPTINQSLTYKGCCAGVGGHLPESAGAVPARDHPAAAGAGGRRGGPGRQAVHHGPGPQGPAQTLGEHGSTGRRCSVKARGPVPPSGCTSRGDVSARAGRDLDGGRRARPRAGGAAAGRGRGSAGVRGAARADRGERRASAQRGGRRPSGHGIRGNCRRHCCPFSGVHELLPVVCSALQVQQCNPRSLLEGRTSLYV